MAQENREAWLNTVADCMAPWFADLGHPLPAYRLTIGFPSSGKRGRRIGECWDGSCSEDGSFEILIRPDQDDAVMVAGILAHELVHAAVGLEAGHGPKFRKVAVAIGLEGKMRSTVPGAAMVARIQSIIAKVGPLPHARLAFDGETSGPKRQTTRMLKCECLECGYTVRIARKWLEVGVPHCPAHGPMQAEITDDDLTDDDKVPEGCSGPSAEQLAPRQIDIEELIASAPNLSTKPGA